MTYDDFCKQLIDDGIAAARADYADDRPDMLAGSLEGFEACRGKAPHEILELLSLARQESRVAMQRAYENDTPKGFPNPPATGNVFGARYQHLACKEAEIEWVLNVVSAALESSGEKPLTYITARGVLAAGRILNGGLLTAQQTHPEKSQ
jgi:hypothetical protein